MERKPSYLVMWHYGLPGIYEKQTGKYLAKVCYRGVIYQKTFDVVEDAINWRIDKKMEIGALRR